MRFRAASSILAQYCLTYTQQWRGIFRFILLLSPFPVSNFGEVYAVLSDVLSMLDELILHLLDEVRAAVAKLREIIDRRHDEVEAIQSVKDSHVEGRGDGALFDVAADVDVLVVASVSQLMDEAGIAVEGEDDGLVGGEDHVVISLRQAVRVLLLALETHQVNDVDNADAQFGERAAQDGDGGQSLKRRRVAAAGHDDVRLLTLVGGCPLPDADALSAVLYGLLHSQPLWTRMFGGDDDVHVVAGADAVVKAAQQAVCIRRQVQADNVGLLVGDVVEEAGVLMREAVVILLPDVGGEDVVERRDLLTPGELVADLEPLCVLREHGVNYADERLIAVEEAVAAGEQVALEHTLAHVLGEHGVHDSAVGGEMIVGVVGFAVPDTVGFLKYRVQSVGVRLVGAEGAEVALLVVELVDIAHEVAEYGHILRPDAAGEGNIHAVLAEVGHAQILQQQTAVRMGIRAHAAGALGREVEQLLHGSAVIVEQLFGMIGM